jgi:hypothetical protein
MKLMSFGFNPTNETLMKMLEEYWAVSPLTVVSASALYSQADSFTFTHLVISLYLRDAFTELIPLLTTCHFPMS